MSAPSCVFPSQPLRCADGLGRWWNGVIDHFLPEEDS